MSYNCVYGFIDVTTVLSLSLSLSVTEIFMNLTGASSPAQLIHNYVCEVE